jgi:hypothetical protein
LSQQERKAQEGEVVRRLTIGAGATALGLAWYFTASAATAVPIVFGAQPTGEGNEPASWAEQLDDRVFVRTVHVQATSLRGPAGGVKSGTTSATGSSSAAGYPTTAGGAAATANTSAGRVTSSGGTTTTTSGAAAPAPASSGGGSTTVTTVTAPPPPPPPPPTPAATTGGSTAK